jgi:hypothetical protein
MQNKIKIVDVLKQPMQSGYETLRHETPEISESVKTIYIMEVMLYHKTMLHTIQVLSSPFTHMYLPCSPDDPFEYSKIKKQITTRLNYINFPYQGGASVCGPAAFFYCLQTDRPDIYAQAAWELWRYGNTKIGQIQGSIFNIAMVIILIIIACRLEGFQ